MNLPEKIKNERAEELLVAAQLAVAFAYLNEAPFDSWSHEGTPAEMATYVVIDAKERGHLSFLINAILGIRYGR